MSDKLVKSFKPFLLILTRRYTPAQMEVSDFQSYESIQDIVSRYCSEIEIHEVRSESLENYGLSVLNETDFDIYPPRPHQFASKIKEKEDIGDFFGGRYKWAQPMLEDLYSHFERRYKNLWHKSSVKSSIIQSWGRFVIDYGISKKSLESGISRLIDDFRSNKYPPSEPDVEIAFCSALKDTEIPSPKEAFRIASEKGFHDEINPLVSYARMKFGFYRLKTSADGAMESSFSEVYRNAIKDYINGEINPFFNQKEINSLECDMFDDVSKKKRVSPEELFDMLGSV